MKASNCQIYIPGKLSFDFIVQQVDSLREKLLLILSVCLSSGSYNAALMAAKRKVCGWGGHNSRKTLTAATINNSLRKEY